MPQPWDRPELVREGDADPNHTYMSVGRVLSQWESVEIQLGYIYAAAVEQHGDWYALLDYGKGTTTAHRLNLLHSAVNTFFVKHPDQAAEGRASSVVNLAENFAARRHDVAHGIVRDKTWARWRIPPDPRDATGFFLLPSHYRGKAYDNDTAFPIYAYTSPSLEKLRHQLILLETEASGVAAHLNRHAGGSTRSGG
jgi:hypothetical protein